jgi:pantothenate kinase type III
LGKTTHDAVRLGSYHAAIAIIAHESEIAAKWFKSTPTYVITGGDAKTISESTSIPFNCIPNLVLYGLSLLIKNIT